MDQAAASRVPRSSTLSSGAAPAVASIAAVSSSTVSEENAVSQG
jgi:hypothetical protein